MKSLVHSEAEGLSVPTEQADKPAGPRPMPRKRPTSGWLLTTRGGPADRYVVRPSESAWGLVCTLFCGPQNRRADEARTAGLMMAAAPELLAMVQEAAKQFRFYQAQHAAKDTPEADAKAIVNADLAHRCEQAIAKATGAAS